MKNKAGSSPVRSMTALSQYARLETFGLWRETPEAQRREVIISFGEASLVISDPRTETALSHWSLPAVHRINPEGAPALYSPGADAGEELEIEDDVMIGALEKVRDVVAARQRRPGRVRLWAMLVTLAGLIGLGVFWLPGALVTHTASVVPLAKRVEIARRIITDTQHVAPVCDTPLGRRAAIRLRDRLLGADGGEIVFVVEGLEHTAHLPGRYVLVGNTLLQAHDAPETLAGHVVAERLRADLEDPLLPLLRASGLRATFQLLTTGDLPDTALRGYGAAVIARPPEPVPDEQFIDRMEAAGIATTPYARSLDLTGAARPGLVEGDPFRSIPPRPVMSDGDWVSLQGICG